MYFGSERNIWILNAFYFFIFRNPTTIHFNSMAKVTTYQASLLDMSGLRCNLKVDFARSTTKLYYFSKKVRVYFKEERVCNRYDFWWRMRTCGTRHLMHAALEDRTILDIDNRYSSIRHFRACQSDKLGPCINFHV